MNGGKSCLVAVFLTPFVTSGHFLRPNSRPTSKVDFLFFMVLILSLFRFLHVVFFCASCCRWFVVSFAWFLKLVVEVGRAFIHRTNAVIALKLTRDL